MCSSSGRPSMVNDKTTIITIISSSLLDQASSSFSRTWLFMRMQLLRSQGSLLRYYFPLLLTLLLSSAASWMAAGDYRGRNST